MGDITTAIAIAAALTGVDPALLNSLCYVESGHNVKAYVHQDGGSPSYGVCQVKLSTARALGFTGQAAQLMDPSWNAFYASKYLAKQHRRYGSWEKAISAYNCGHACNNNKYVTKVMGGFHELHKRRVLPLY